MPIGLLPACRSALFRTLSSTGRILRFISEDAGSRPAGYIIKVNVKFMKTDYKEFSPIDSVSFL